MKQHCETCTCGLTHVQWSDRDSWVDLDSDESIADTVMSCALDHSYDRTATGVPLGIPDEMEAILAPVIDKHLSRIEPKWKDNTVYMFEESDREVFRADLIAALQAGRSVEKGKEG